MSDNQRKVDEEAKFLKQITSHPDIIPGIHNYCDRWCERCPLANRCTVYHMENRMRGKKVGLEQTNDAWEDVNTMLNVAAKLLTDQFEAMGIDVDELEAIAKAEEPNINYNPQEAMAVKLANEYSSTLAKWLRANRSQVLDRFQLLNSVQSTSSKAIAEAFEVIQYYITAIASKTYRAFMYPVGQEKSADSWGSSKVCLIIVDRSIAAWVKVLEIIPDLEDDILHFLSLLAKIKKEILKRFPNAMDFVRPGFDE